VGAGIGTVTEIVHPVDVTELEEWTRRIAATFLGDPNGPRVARRLELLRRAWSPERAWAVRSGGQIVATFATLDRRVTLIGAAHETPDLPLDAVTAVTVAPTHRRRGLLRAMMIASMRAARERGDPLSGLIAAEWPIYGRYGYAPATSATDWILHRSRRGSEVAGDPSRLRHVEAAELRELAPAVFAVERRQRGGQLDRDASYWHWRLGADEHEALEPLPHNLLVHDGPDGADGVVAWTSTRDSQLLFPRGVAEVPMLIAASPEAYRDIWAYLSGLDGIDEVHIGNRPVDEPVRWLLPDARTLEATRHYDFLWLRILDPVAVLSTRRYAADGELVLEIVDDAMDGFAAGRVRLSVQDGAAQCAAAGPGARVDVRLSQRRLVSILLGGFTPGELALGGGVEEQTPGTCDRLRAMLAAPVAPWNATWF
jgi:predicted acetyltransferase